jgi:hypothetical protein
MSSFSLVVFASMHGTFNMDQLHISLELELLYMH